jgi:hypothetical protein
MQCWSPRRLGALSSTSKTASNGAEVRSNDGERQASLWTSRGGIRLPLAMGGLTASWPLVSYKADDVGINVRGSFVPPLDLTWDDVANIEAVSRRAFRLRAKDRELAFLGIAVSNRDALLGIAKCTRRGGRKQSSASTLVVRRRALGPSNAACTPQSREAASVTLQKPAAAGEWARKPRAVSPRMRACAQRTEPRGAAQPERMGRSKGAR